MRSNSGFVLIVSLLVMVVITILVFGASFTSLVDRQIAQNQQTANASYYVAQAGLNQYKTLVFKNLVDYYAAAGEGWCESPVSSGIFENGVLVLSNGDTTDPQPFGPGSYEVSFDVSPGNENYMILTSVGRVGPSQTTLQLVATAGGGPVGAWDNALLAAGADPNSKAINGNVSVYGSVHLVRGDLEIDNSNLSVSGTAGIYNNYAGEGTPANDIRTEVQTITGRSDVDLCARLKVKSGSVYLESGSNVLGAPGEGNALFSVHLGNGKVYEGKAGSDKVREIKDHADPNEDPRELVNLRNPVSGMNSGYEGFDVEFPLLKPGFPDDRDGFTVVGDDPSCAWLVSPSSSTITLPPPAPGSCGNEHGSIAWTADGHLEISGVVNTGVLGLDVKESIQYDGRGVLRIGTVSPNLDAEGNIVLTTEPNFTLKGEITPVVDGSFPTGSALAIETTGDAIMEATGVNSPMAMMVYAAGTAEFKKQSLLVGAVVADTFILGSQVPKVAYQPDVRDVAETLCMVGSFCHQGVVPPNPGTISDIAIERRDSAAIDN